MPSSGLNLWSWQERESPLGEIFGAYVRRLGYGGNITRFFYQNVVVEWGDTPDDIGLADGGRINVVSLDGCLMWRIWGTSISG